MVAFLGGTIGNLYLEERKAFLGALGDLLQPGDSVLLGTDLVKSADRLIAAYDDSQGVTEAFIRNSLTVVNRETRGGLRPGRLLLHPVLGRPHGADGHAAARGGPAAGQCAGCRPGAGAWPSARSLRVEISTKFRVSRIAAELEAAGLAVARVWTDEPGDFALTLAVKP
ncbi:L-histidine N(alpha)-methyltransferase [Nocardioides convexus]|uniref:L-histidine N(alpha)-methyltransferase n=1 Tax=Nocardioides convexus TaxID=2712224 RepID=UPI0024184CA1|nr:L-histidine N(alpha)-methyltransferase [Nocardioides convexus]